MRRNRAISWIRRGHALSVSGAANVTRCWPYRISIKQRQVAGPAGVSDGCRVQSGAVEGASDSGRVATPRTTNVRFAATLIVAIVRSPSCLSIDRLPLSLCREISIPSHQISIDQVTHDRFRLFIYLFTGGINLWIIIIYIIIEPCYINTTRCIYRG